MVSRARLVQPISAALSTRQPPPSFDPPRGPENQHSRHRPPADQHLNLRRFRFAYLVVLFQYKRINTYEEVETLKSAVPMGVVNIVGDSVPNRYERFGQGFVAARPCSICGGSHPHVPLCGGKAATVSFGGFLILSTMRAKWRICLLVIVANALVTDVVYALIQKKIPEGADESVVASTEGKVDLSLDDISVM